MSSHKTFLKPITEKFGYLGYIFLPGKITVRTSSIEHLLQSIAAQFSEYSHNREKKLHKFKYLTEDRVKEIFVLELNERITGAISDAKRYGWVAYFSQITDLTLLHRLDCAVSGMFRRLTDFGGQRPDSLKYFARAFYEMKFSPNAGYVRDYDKIKTIAEKITFLKERGYIDPESDPEREFTDVDINQLFEKYVRRSIFKMQADEGIIY